MNVLYLSRSPALALPPMVVQGQIEGMFAGLKLRRARPDAVIFAQPAMQTSGPWPQIGLCSAPEDAYRYRPGTHLVAGTEVCAGRLAQKGRPVVCLPLPMPGEAGPIPAGVPHLLAVAPLVRASGLDLLLRALAGLGPLSLSFAGQGAMGEDLAELAQRLGVALTIRPFATWDDYRAATMVIHPPLADQEGSAIRAAMAAGRPLVASATDAARELLLANETGMLVPPGDAEALRHSIRLLLEDPAMGADLGQAAVAHYQTRFDPLLLAARWERYLGGLTAPAVPPASKEKFNVRRKI